MVGVGSEAAAARQGASALVIGAGGLGCAAAWGLALGGVGRVILVDDDRVEESNLHRQVLHRRADVGAPKAESLARALRARFPALAAEARVERFTAGNARALVRAADVVLDGSDNLATKFLANDAAVAERRPLVHGAAVGTGGQWMSVPAGGRPCYRCLFEDLPPPDADAPSCAEAGVLGPVPAVIGARQALAALALLAGAGRHRESRDGEKSCMGLLIRYDSHPMTFRSVTFRPNPGCRACGAEAGATAPAASGQRGESRQ